MDIMQEETFGPALPIAIFRATLGQVIALANDSACPGLTQLGIHHQPQRSFLRDSAACNSAKPISIAKTSKPCKAFTPAGNNRVLAVPTANTGSEEYLQTQVVYLETEIE